MKCYMVYARTYPESAFTLWETKEAAYDHMKRLLHSLEFQDMHRFMKKHRLKIKNTWELTMATNNGIHFSIQNSTLNLKIEYSYETEFGSCKQLSLYLMPYTIDLDEAIDLRPDF